MRKKCFIYKENFGLYHLKMILMIWSTSIDEVLHLGLEQKQYIQLKENDKNSNVNL